jgi:hypothetical protein
MGLAIGSMGAAQAATTATIATTATPIAGNGVDLVHVTIPSAGITLGYPSDWTVAKYSGPSKAVKKKLAKLNPNLASAVEASSAPNTNFYAIHNVPGGFSENLNVIVMTNSGFPTTLDDFDQYS